MVEMTKVIYLFIGFMGLILGLTSVLPWVALAVVRYAVEERQKVK